MKPEKFNIYMDASGDTGLKFDAGSTKTFTVACLLEHETDNEYNRTVIAEAKRIVGCKIRDELKYATIKRHPKKFELLANLLHLRTYICAFSHVKVAAMEWDGHAINVANQATGILNALDNALNILGVERAEVWADASNPTLEKQIKELVLDEKVKASHNSKSQRIAEIIEEPHFPSSVSVQMIQAADIFAGLIAEFIEANLAGPIHLCQTCVPPLWPTRKQNKCQPKRVRRKVSKVELFDVVEPLLCRSSNGWITPYGLFVYPADKQWSFIECIGSTKK